MISQHLECSTLAHHSKRNLLIITIYSKRLDGIIYTCMWAWDEWTTPYRRRCFPRAGNQDAKAEITRRRRKTEEEEKKAPRPEELLINLNEVCWHVAAAEPTLNNTDMKPLTDTSKADVEKSPPCFQSDHNLGHKRYLKGKSYSTNCLLRMWVCLLRYVGWHHL